MTLQQKLHPSRFTAMSPKMTSIVAAVLGEEWTHPRLIRLCILHDAALGMQKGDCGYNHFLGSSADFLRNWKTLIQAADLTEEETKELETLWSRNVVDHRT